MLDSCHSFIIFDENPLDGPGRSDEREEYRVIVLEPAQAVFGDIVIDDALDGLSLSAQSDSSWRQDDSQHRFVQFSFNLRYFDIDLPDTTLYQAEAEEILQSRRGFFYVKDRPCFEHPGEDVASFNPLRKVYIYGDEREAAEDMAFVWFHVWKFPVDWRFYITAAAFHAKTNWERGFPLDASHPVAGRMESIGLHERHEKASSRPNT